MAPGVSLDNQLFWTQPRRKPRTRVGSTKSNLNISPVIRERSTDEPTCISNCKPKTDGIDNNAGNASGNVEAWQLDDVVRLPAMPLQPEFLVDNVDSYRESSCDCGVEIGVLQQTPTIVSGLKKTDGVENLASQVASPLSLSSSTSFASQSTPITTPDDNILSDYSNELYPIDPALTGPANDCASACYPLIDSDSAPDASGTVSHDNFPFSRDGPDMALNGYASDSATNFSTTSILPRWAVWSKSYPDEIRECLEDAAYPNQRLRKRLSPANKEAQHVASDVSRDKADEHHPALIYGPNFPSLNELVDDSVEQPPPKRRKVERSSKDDTDCEESRSRCCSTEDTIQIEPNASTPLLSTPDSPVADTEIIDSQENAAMAEFGEWPLHNVLLKRITLNGVATFQLQFDWNLCATHSQLGRAIPKMPNKPDGSDRPKRTIDDSATRAKFTPDEDSLIAVLKEEQQLPWTEIHRIHQQDSRQFPTRSKESLQVRYCTRLKTRRDVESYKDSRH